MSNWRRKLHKEANMKPIIWQGPSACDMHCGSVSKIDPPKTSASPVEGSLNKKEITQKPTHTNKTLTTHKQLYIPKYKTRHTHTQTKHTHTHTDTHKHPRRHRFGLPPALNLRLGGSRSLKAPASRRTASGTSARRQLPFLHQRHQQKMIT